MNITDKILLESELSINPEENPTPTPTKGKGIKTATPTDVFNVILVNINKTQTKQAYMKTAGKVKFDQTNMEFQDLKNTNKKYKYNMKVSLGGPMRELFRAFNDVIQAIMEKKRLPEDKVVFKNVTDAKYYTDGKGQAGTLAPTMETIVFVVGKWGTAKISIQDMLDLNVYSKQNSNGK